MSAARTHEEISRAGIGLLCRRFVDEGWRLDLVFFVILVKYDDFVICDIMDTEVCDSLIKGLSKESILVFVMKRLFYRLRCTRI